MCTSAEILLLLKNGKQFIIRTPLDGYLSSCGRQLWELFGSLTSEQWNMLNERLETMTWVNQYDKAYAHGLSCTECWSDCPTEPTEHTVFDVLELEYYMPANILLSAMNNTTQHIIDFPSKYADFYYKIDFTSKEFSTANMLGGYVNLPFTSK